MPKMSPTELKALLQSERNSSLGGTMTSDLSTDRAKAMDYYNGDMAADMPAADGLSSAVSSDVADAVEGLMPSLMEIFAGGETVVRFEPVDEQDEEAAEQETDYVNHVFMQKNAGFVALYSFVKDALLQKNGIVKVYWEETERENERETYQDQPDDVFAVMASQPDAEIIAHSKNTADDGTITHDVTLSRRKKTGCARVMPVPPEEFGISKNARTIRESTYCFHETKKTQASLIADGYDATQVESLPSTNIQTNQEELSRDTLHEEEGASETLNKAARMIKVIEHYVLMDYERNDKPALYRVTTGGNQLEVLTRNGEEDVVPVDVMPFAAMTPIIVTHRFFGKSIADLVMDIQRIKTALVRGALNNVYLANNQRVEVAESLAHERTLDDLLVNRPGGVVRTKQPGAVNPIPNQPIGPFVFPMIEYMDATREWRTGVTRQGQGLDPNALQNIGEKAVLDAANAARAKTKLIARIFAETGVKDMFYLLHSVIRKNERQPTNVKLKKKWTQIDPRNWKSRDDMTPNVGLGSGSREQEAAMLTNILNIQKEIIMSGPSQMLVKPKNVYNTLEKLIERVGLKTIEPYFSDPEEIDPQTGQPKQPPPPQPDPDVMKIQMEAQMAEKADQRKAEIEKVQAQADIATQQQAQAAENAKNEREYQLKAQLAMFQAQLDQQRFEREEARKDREHQQKMDMAHQQHTAAMQQGQFNMMAGQQAHEQKMEQAKAKPNGAGA